MHPKDMHLEVLELWNQFKSGDIDIEGTRIRMQKLKPLLRIPVKMNTDSGGM